MRWGKFRTHNEFVVRPHVHSVKEKSSLLTSADGTLQNPFYIAIGVRTYFTERVMQIGFMMNWKSTMAALPMR